MRFLIPICLLTVGHVASHPQGYTIPGPLSTLGASGFSSGFDDSGEVTLFSGGIGNYAGGCLPSEILQTDGTCVTPHITRSIFVYAAPKVPPAYVPPPPIPKPRINYNVVFIRAPEGIKGLEPIVIPPPQEKTIVYVLTKNGKIGQHVIEVPPGPTQSPEVYYVNYNEGDNPVLPGGISLQEALTSAAPHDGLLIGGPGFISDDISGGIGGGIGGGISGGISAEDGLVGGVGLNAGYGVGVGDTLGGGVVGGGFANVIGDGISDGHIGGSVTYVSGGHGRSFGGGAYDTGAHSGIISGLPDNNIQSGLGGFLSPNGIRQLYKRSKLNIKFQ